MINIGLLPFYIGLFPIYVALLLIILVLLYWIKFKLQNPFWSKQPVVHKHNLLLRYSRNPSIIWNEFYIPKFTNSINIQTKSWYELNDKDNIQKHISENFYKEKNGHYRPSLDKHIAPYYDNDDNSYTSKYILDNILIGCIFNRTLRIHLSGNNFNVSYIDYLCVHKGHRKKCVAPELIQTHEHFQRTKSNKKCLVSMFKKEGRLHNFIPLVQYTNCTYSLREKNSFNNVKMNIPYVYQFTEVSLSMKKDLMVVLETIRQNKICFVIPPLEILLQLIERKSIQIYAIIYKSSIVALYFFRNTGLYINSSKESVECFASMNFNTSNEIFTQGFFKVINKIKPNYSILHIEELGDNVYILRIIRKLGIKAKYCVPCAYYLYNYSNKTVEAKDVTLLV